MNKLFCELQRLYFLPDQHWHGQPTDPDGAPGCPAENPLTPEIVARTLAGEKSVAFDLVSRDGMARTMVVNFTKPADWEAVANLYRAVQDDLDLPAPALSVSGRKGFRLWFSLAEPVPAAEARHFLDTLCRKYLADIPSGNIGFRPDDDWASAGGKTFLKLVPALHATTGRWSAFIDPSLGSMFVEESGLEMAPNMDKQASILAGLASIEAAEFQRAVSILQQPDEPEADTAPPAMDGSESAGPTGRAAGRRRATLNVGEHFSDPKSFLLAVMNDPSASAGQRIKAARALLPYFAKDA